jgi:hypothetical protein
MWQILKYLIHPKHNEIKSCVLEFKEVDYNYRQME